MNTVSVNLGSRSYEILVAPGLISEAGPRIQAAGLKGRAAIITDSNVAPHYLEQVKPLSRSGFRTSHSPQLPAGEASKSMSDVEELSRELIQAGHDRSSLWSLLAAASWETLQDSSPPSFTAASPSSRSPPPSSRKSTHRCRRQRPA